MQDGVWRTVGGRRIFIRDGQDLQSAMNESGKFGRKGQKWDYRNITSYLDKVEKEIDNLKDPFSRKATAIYTALQQQEQTALKLREGIINGTEDGDIHALARINTRIKLLKNKLVNNGIRRSTGR